MFGLSQVLRPSPATCREIASEAFQGPQGLVMPVLRSNRGERI
jgi:hypothetical protein